MEEEEEEKETESRGVERRVVTNGFVFVPQNKLPHLPNHPHHPLGLLCTAVVL